MREPSLRRVGRSLLWIAIVLLCAAPLPAFFSAPVPVSVTTGLVALAVLSIWRPDNGLLVLAGLGPLAAVIEPLTALPHHGHLLLEAAVLIVLGSAALHGAARGGRLVRTAFDGAVLAFILVALVSCVAQVPMAFLRAGHAVTPSAVVERLVHGYFDRAEALAPVWQTALLIEGAALAALTARALRDRVSAVNLRAMIVVGGAAAAALNVTRLLEVALRNPPPSDSFLRVLGGVRFNVHYGDLNAAGSHFAIIAVLAIAGISLRTGRGRLHALAVALAVCALWVSGSRIAMAAAGLCSVGLLAERRGLLLRVSRPVVLAGAAIALLAALFLTLFLLPGRRHGTVAYSVDTRFEVLKAGARMVADRPLVGVGTSQFYALFPHYASPELLRTFEENLGRPVTHENAHNQFLQILAELGVAGFVPFAVILALALRSRDIAVRAALLGFLLTCLAGHPLLTPIVAYVFWLLAGIAVATAPPMAVQLTYLRPAVAALALLLVATLPIRWSYERRHADLADLSIGFSQHWERDDTGRRFRWASDRAALYVPSNGSTVRLPLKTGEGELVVRLLLDGRLAAGIRVPPGVWVDAILFLPTSRPPPKFWRIDLLVERTGAVEVAPERPLMVGRVETDR